jgi:succinoglycan biosynthesis transport protein ExoP
MALQQELSPTPRDVERSPSALRLDAVSRKGPRSPVERSGHAGTRDKDGAASTWTTVLFAVGVARRWAFLCFPVGCVLALAGAAFTWFFIPSVFEAQALLTIQDRQPVIAFQDKAEADSRKFVQTQVELMRTPLVLGGVLNDANVAAYDEIKYAADPVAWMADNLKVKPRAMSEVYEIRFRSANPELAAAVANGVMDAYIHLQSENDSRENQLILDLLEQEKERQHQELGRLQENVQTLSMRISTQHPGVATGAEQNRIVLAAVTDDERRLAESEVERQMLEARLKAAQETRNAPAAPQKVEQIERMVSEDADVAAISARMRLLQDEIRAFAAASSKGEADPLLQGRKSQLAELETALSRAREIATRAVTTTTTDGLSEQKAAQLSQLQREIAEKKKLEELFRQRIDMERQQRERLGGQEADLEMARGELARADDVYKRMSDKLIAMRTEMRAPTRVGEVSRATVPTEAVSHPFSKMMAAALALFCLPWGIALCFEHVRRNIQESEQVERATELTVLGEIAALPAKRAGKGESTQEELRRRELYQESIDAFRTNLVVSEEMRKVRVLSVASAVSSEGKTSVASQLAVSLARASGQPTILIDADLRAPDLHGIFDVPNDVGLADVLDGKVSLTDAVVTDWHEHLHLLPAGRLSKSPYALLGSGALESMLEELKERYHYVVIDAPPVLSASEALLIAKAADGTVLCAMKDRTREPQLRLAAQRLEAAGAKMLGAVLSGVPSRRYAYKYGGYYYYGNTGST